VELRAAARWTELLRLPGPQQPPAPSTETVRWPAQPSGSNGMRLHFEDGAFDSLACPLGISILSKARDAMAEWLRVLKPEGKVLSSAFGAKAFRPLLDLYANQLFDYGLARAAGVAVAPWRRFDGPEAVSRLMRDAGFTRVTVLVEQRGRSLPSAEKWWDLLAASGLLSPLDKLSRGELAAFKEEHLHEVGLLAKSAGIWLDIPVASVAAYKPQ